MKAGDFAAVMAALGRVGRELKREREGDFAASLARTAPDDQIERMDAQCVECGDIHPGIWQHMPGGRRIRVPIVHEIRGERCPGSFAAAVLRERSTTGEPDQ